MDMPEVKDKKFSAVCQICGEVITIQLLSGQHWEHEDGKYYRDGHYAEPREGSIIMGEAAPRLSVASQFAWW